MTKVQKADPYHKLLRVVIALAVLFVVALVGYLLVDSYRRGEQLKANQLIVEQNNAMVEEYNAQVLAQRESTTTTEQGTSYVWPQAAAEGVDIVNLKGIPVQTGRQELVTRAQALTGGLMVVNRWHPLPQDFAIVEGELQSIMDTTERRVPVDARVVSLFPNAITALDEMLQAASAEGLDNFLVRSGYRSVATQQQGWDGEAAKYTNLTGDALNEQVSKVWAYPGTSDYHTGLSFLIDAYSTNDPVLNSAAFNETEQSKWLWNNAYKYGFVFRFPVTGYPSADAVDKSYKTGIDLKLDTYRYVGVPHALVMHELGLCLEEYVEYLIENPHIAVYQDGGLLYEIYRLPNVSADTEVNVPEGATSFTASADNLGGLVIAAIY